MAAGSTIVNNIPEVLNDRVYASCSAGGKWPPKMVFRKYLDRMNRERKIFGTKVVPREISYRMHYLHVAVDLFLTLKPCFTNEEFNAARVRARVNEILLGFRVASGSGVRCTSAGWMWQCVHAATANERHVTPINEIVRVKRTVPRSFAKRQAFPRVIFLNFSIVLYQPESWNFDMSYLWVISTSCENIFKIGHLPLTMLNRRSKLWSLGKLEKELKVKLKKS